MAIDSTAIHVYPRPRKVIIPDPQAGWGYKSDRYGNQRKFYGYRTHLIVDTTYELPILLLVTPANIHNSVVASNLLKQAKSKVKSL